MIIWDVGTNFWPSCNASVWNATQKERMLNMSVRPSFHPGLSFTDILILASRITVFDTSYNMKQGIT